MTKRQFAKLEALLDRVRKATQARGKKTELAAFLETTPQVLNDWLSGRFAPGGEVTLQLLEWVQGEEANQTSARGSALTPPRAKTRKTHHVNEKKTESRRRK